MEAFIAKLAELGVAHETVQHPAVSTADAQVPRRCRPRRAPRRAAPPTRGAVPSPLIAPRRAARAPPRRRRSPAAAAPDPQTAALAAAGAAAPAVRCLFLRDKRGRLYLVAALPETRVDLRLLGLRLGLGKAAPRLAPEPLLATVLGVAPGSVTPLAAAAPSAAGVALLLDSKIQALPAVHVHPMVNTASTALAPAGLEAYLKACGAAYYWVDLEARVAIDRDTPPDLKGVADAAAELAPEEAGAGGGADGAAAAGGEASGGAGGKKKGKGGGATGGDAGTAAARAAAAATAAALDVEAAAAEVLAAAAAGAPGAAADVAARLTVLKNAAYAAGFKAARGMVAGWLEERPGM
jgi:hypothetical protein